MTAKLKKLEEEQAESETQLSLDSGPGEQREASAVTIVSGSACQSPFEPESRRRVGFQDEAAEQWSNDHLTRQLTSKQQHFEHRRGVESVLLGAEAAPAHTASSRSQSEGKYQEKGPSLHSICVEPERLPRATAEQDGSFVLKGASRFQIAGGQSRVQKLESFDRRIGRQPNAIKEVSLMT